VLMNRLSRENLAGDLGGGLTAGVVALPLAFGVASGAGAVAGLYGAAWTGLFASLFGGTRPQVSGPTGPMTVVAATVFTQHAGQTPPAKTTTTSTASATAPTITRPTSLPALIAARLESTSKRPIDLISSNRVATVASST
jgi:MFS superfamily sulfate permease-like transporter